jgi:hypothetical protein
VNAHHAIVGDQEALIAGVGLAWPKVPTDRRLFARG